MAYGQARRAAEGNSSGRYLRHFRKAIGWTQDHLAAETGYQITREQISNIERGKHTPHRSTVFRLAGALGVKAWELFPEVVKPLAIAEDPRQRELRRREEDQILRRHEPTIRRFAIRWGNRYSGHAGAVEELVQDGMIAAWQEGIRGYDPCRGPLDRRIVFVAERRIQDSARGRSKDRSRFTIPDVEDANEYLGGLLN